MAKIELKFLCAEDEDCFIKCEERNGIIDIVIKEGYDTNCIFLDKSTAIKFAKTLRTEINKIDSEVSNG